MGEDTIEMLETDVRYEGYLKKGIEQIEKAKQMDLLTYLQSYEPGNLKKISHDTWCTKEHDSLKISNGKWHWFSRHIGGKTALDYIIKVKGISFVKAVEIITGYAAVLPPVFSRKAAILGSATTLETTVSLSRSASISTVPRILPLT